MVRHRLHLEVRIWSSPPYTRSSGGSSAGRGKVVFLVNLLGSDRFLCLLVWLYVWLFWSIGLIFGDGCCSSVLVLWGLSMMTSHLSTIIRSTTTSFARLHWWRGEDGSIPLARASVCIFRWWSKEFFIILLPFGFYYYGWLPIGQRTFKKNCKENDFFTQTPYHFYIVIVINQWFACVWELLWTCYQCLIINDHKYHKYV
jgi:hypothetical protein